MTSDSSTNYLSDPFEREREGGREGGREGERERELLYIASVNPNFYSEIGFFLTEHTELNGVSQNIKRPITFFTPHQKECKKEGAAF